MDVDVQGGSQIPYHSIISEETEIVFVGSKNGYIVAIICHGACRLILFRGRFVIFLKFGSIAFAKLDCYL